jgi:hypothetical protein
MKQVPRLFLTKHYSLNLKKLVNFEVATTEMNPRIPWEPVQDPLGSAKHTLETTRI